LLASTPGEWEEALTGLLGQDLQPPSHAPRFLTLVAAAVAVIAVAAAIFAWRESTPPPAPVAQTAAAPEPAVITPADAAPAEPYQVDAAVYRVDPDRNTRLAGGDAVRPGDRLFLELRSSVPAFVYVVNEDEQGHHYLLFPLNGFTQKNPLPAGAVHRLPGTRGDLEHYWQVTEPGVRDHFVIFVSPAPLTSFEQTFAEMPRASEDTPVFSAPLTMNALNTLRGIGGVASAETPRLDAPLHEQYRTPLSDRSETTTGTWVRLFTVDSR
jgi:hypothetical protein